MAPCFVDLSLELRYPTASPPRHKKDSYRYVYFSDVDLLGSRMTVVLSVPVSESMVTPFHKHGTWAQVIGAADILGDTIFMEMATVFTSERFAWRDPFIRFNASISQWSYTVFRATLARGPAWTAAVDARCSYDPENEHLRGLEELPVSTNVVISGTLTGFDDGVIEVDVHDISLDGGEPPCSARSLVRHSVLSPVQQSALCQWFSNTNGGAHEHRTHELSSRPPSAGVVTPVIRVEANAGFSDPILARNGAANAPSNREVAPHNEEAGDATRCSDEEESALRYALSTAFAFRDEGPIGQTPVDSAFDEHTCSEAGFSSQSAVGSRSRSPSGSGAAYYFSKARPRLLGRDTVAARASTTTIVALTPLDVIDLTGDSSDDEPSAMRRSSSAAGTGPASAVFLPLDVCSRVLTREDDISTGAGLLGAGNMERVGVMG